MVVFGAVWRNLFGVNHGFAGPLEAKKSSIRMPVVLLPQPALSLFLTFRKIFLYLPWNLLLDIGLMARRVKLEN